MVFTAFLAGISVYLFSLYIQEHLYERARFQRRIQQITIGSYDLLQRAASVRGQTPIYRIKKKSFLSLKNMRVVAVACLALSVLILQPSGISLSNIPIVILPAIPTLVLFSIASMKTQKKQKILNELPGAMDLLIICLGSGLGINAAFEKVAHEIAGSNLGREFRTLVNETQSGLPLEEALRNMATRIEINEVSNVVGPVIQAHKTGSAIVETFKIQAASLREKLQLQIKEKQMKAPILVLLPMVLFIFPVIFLVILGPVIILALQGKFL